MAQMSLSHLNMRLEISPSGSIHLSEPRATPVHVITTTSYGANGIRDLLPLLAMPRTSPEASVVDNA